MHTENRMRPRARQRLLGLLAALLALVSSAAIGSQTAHATQPPKSCVDDPGGAGCPHDGSGGSSGSSGQGGSGGGDGGVGTGGGGGSGAVLNTYVYVDMEGTINYYRRGDGARASTADANRLDKWVRIFDPAGYCWLSFDRPGSIACRYH